MIRYYCDCSDNIKATAEGRNRLKPTTVHSDDTCTKCGYYAVGIRNKQLIKDLPAKQVQKHLLHYCTAEQESKIYGQNYRLHTNVEEL